jgi:hypothetical protein
MNERTGRRLRRLMALALPAVVGCTAVAPGPVVLVMPAHGRSLAQFKVDDDLCRDFALDRLGGVSPEAAAVAGVASTALAAMGLFGLAGAVIDGSNGARIGAAVGAVTGAAGAGLRAYGPGSTTQARLDNAYVQCMFTRGHRVPAVASGPGEAARSRLRVGVSEPW